MAEKLLSILVPTLASRKPFLERMLASLRPDPVFFPQEIEIRLLTDDGRVTVGAKRQQLLQEAQGMYVAFIDDDDRVTADYVPQVMNAIHSRPDCVGIRGIYTVDGRNPAVFEHSVKHTSWFERDGVFYRCPNHLNPVRRDLALRAGFPDLPAGEDSAYSYALRPHLKSEVMIDPPVYLYDYRSDKGKP